MQSGGLTLTEGFREILPTLGPRLARALDCSVGTDVLDCGRYGCVLQTDDGRVVKLTGDLDEPIGWLYVQGKQRQGDLRFLGGAAHVDATMRVDVLFPGAFGSVHPRRFAVGLVERVVPSRRVYQRGSDATRLVRHARRWLNTARDLAQFLDDRIVTLGEAAKSHTPKRVTKACLGAPPPTEDLCAMIHAAGRDDVYGHGLVNALAATTAGSRTWPTTTSAGGSSAAPQLSCSTTSVASSSTTAVTGGACRRCGDGSPSWT